MTLSEGILDSHVHVWDSRIFTYPWLEDVPGLPRTVLPADVISDFVTSAIFIEADVAPTRALQEVRWVSRLHWPTLRGIVAAVDLRSQSLFEDLRTVSGSKMVVGIRHLLQGESIRSITDKSLVPGLRLLGELGLTFDACVTSDQLEALAELLDSVNETRVAVDHIGKPPVDAGLTSAEGQSWAHSIRRLSERPATFVKLSGLSVESSSQKSYARNAPAFVAHAVECFGVDRSMIGSDAPVSTLLGPGGSFANWAQLVRDVIGESDWPMVSRAAAEEFYLNRVGISA